MHQNGPIRSRLLPNYKCLMLGKPFWGEYIVSGKYNLETTYINETI